MNKLCFSLDVCKKGSKMSVPTDFDFVKPFIGLRKVIENPQLRSRGNDTEAKLSPTANFESGTKKPL